MHRTLKIGHQVVGEIAVSNDPDPKIRRAQNMSLAMIYIPMALYAFRSRYTFSPDERYRVVLAEVTRTTLGVADEDNIAAVKDRFETSEGPFAFLHHQVRRSSGQVVCDQCGKEYYRHPFEERIEGATRICNGDLVHL